MGRSEGRADDTEARTAKGEQRREKLVAVAAALLLEGGPEAVTARATAARAGVPLGALTYYFEDLARLRREAIRRLMGQHLEEAAVHRRGLDGASSVPMVAERVVAVVYGPFLASGRDGLVALYAQVLGTVQDPALSPDVAVFDAQITEAVADLLEAAHRTPTRARAVVACTDGFALAELLSGSIDVRIRLVARVGEILDLLAPPLEHPSTATYDSDNEQSLNSAGVARRRWNPEQRRAHLLETALRCFMDRGPSVSTAHIAREAGVSEGLLYRYFPTKDDLWLAAVTRSGSFAERAGRTFRTLAAGSIADGLSRIAEDFAEVEPSERKAVALLLGAALRDEPLGDRVRRGHATAGRLLGGALQSSGRLRPGVDAEVAALGLLGGFVLFLMMHHRDPPESWTTDARGFAAQWVATWAAGALEDGDDL